MPVNDAQCIGCGYSLHGLTVARCPECGHRFDPGDPRTFHSPDRGRRGAWETALSFLCWFLAGLYIPLISPYRHRPLIPHWDALPYYIPLLVLLPLAVGFALSGVRFARGRCQVVATVMLVASVATICAMAFAWLNGRVIGGSCWRPASDAVIRMCSIRSSPTRQ